MRVNVKASSTWGRRVKGRAPRLETQSLLARPYLCACSKGRRCLGTLLPMGIPGLPGPAEGCPARVTSTSRLRWGGDGSRFGSGESRPSAPGECAHLLVKTRALKGATRVELACPPLALLTLDLDPAPSTVSLRTSAWPKLHGKF